MLGGVEWKVREEGERNNGGIGGEEEISREEIEEVIKGLKDGKAAGGDGIANEVWKYGGEEVKSWLWEICNKVWRGEGWPEEWSEGVVVPVWKKGKGKKVEEYRGITLTQTAYKIYATVLTKRMRKEVEEKGMLPPSQAGFREGRGTVDQIYGLNYIINKKIAEKNGKMVVLFLDLKAAFDSVDKGKLRECLRKRGVREGLVERCEEVLRETKCRVKVEDKEGKLFWTGRGVRQGCPLSPCLFTMLLADLDEELEREGWGGIKVGGRKIWSMAYADDIAVIAENEEGMKGMIKGLEKYMDEKGLEVNIGKTKVMRCRKGGGRWKKVKWRWKGSEIEEVRKFTYLGYVVSANGKSKEHIRERVRKGAIVMREVWGIGKRRYGGDWARRLWLFDRLVWTVMSYGVEIWGWREREEIERMHERYLRWIMGVGWNTPGYMIREELMREKMRGRAGMRAWGYERRIGEGRGGEIARWCWEEVRERAKKGKVIGEWEKEREEFYVEKGWEIKEIERLREEGEMRGEEIVRREKREQEEERWRRIRETKGNIWYKWIKGKGLPGYLKKGWKEERWQRMARFRLGEEMKGNRYWENEERRLCRVCGRSEETWKHVLEECTDWGRERNWREIVEEILEGEGGGEEWMKRIEEWRGEGMRIDEEESVRGDENGKCGGNGGPRGMNGRVNEEE